MSDTLEPTVKLGEYQGKPMLIINPDSRFLFSFGLSKAKLIVQNIEAIKKFVDSDGKEV